MKVNKDQIKIKKQDKKHIFDLSFCQSNMLVSFEMSVQPQCVASVAKYSLFKGQLWCFIQLGKLQKTVELSASEAVTY